MLSNAVFICLFCSVSVLRLPSVICGPDLCAICCYLWARSVRHLLLSVGQICAPSAVICGPDLCAICCYLWARSVRHLLLSVGQICAPSAVICGPEYLAHRFLYLPQINTSAMFVLLIVCAVYHTLQ
ncbi:hypothetical protein BsWGS_00028 [Bradybaena similaris]